MRVFLTGATGFIGRHVARNLVENGHAVRCLVRKTSQVLPLKQFEAELVEGDVTDRSSVAAGLRGCDWVINLANIYSFWEPNRKVFAEVNVAGTRNVLACALEAGVVKVVHVSTIGIWGDASPLPVTERDAGRPQTMQ